MMADDPTEQIKVLAEASAALMGSASLSETLAHILHMAQRLMEADAYAIWGYDAAHERLTVLSSQGLPQSYLETSAVEVQNVGALPELVVPNLDAEPVLANLKERYQRLGVQSLLVLPLRAASEEWGTLTFYYRRQHDFAAAELVTARALANLSAAAISAVHAEEARIAVQEQLEHTLEEQRRADAALELLAKAGAVFNESLDYHTTLTNLTRVLVPSLADWCGVHVVEEGLVQQLAVGHVDPDKIRLALELQQKYPDDPNAERGVYQVIRTGRPEIMATIPEELLVEAAVDEEHLRLIRELGLTSYVCVPLTTRTAVIGALTLIYAESGRIYTERDLELVQELGRRAGLAVEKARLYQESERTRAELEHSNKAKDEFLGAVSHELRSPVANIFGSARLLTSRGDRLDETERKELLEGIEASSKRMAELIENLLLLARLDFGTGPLMKPVDLAAIVAEVARYTLQDRSYRIIGPESMPSVGEPTYCRQVLNNLLENAQKYAPPEEQIDIVLEASTDEVRVRVLDRGPGVSPEELNLIFDSFYRSAKTSDRPGKGLGLAICKRLVEAMRGTIRATPRPGGGLEVTLCLPNVVLDDPR